VRGRALILAVLGAATLLTLTYGGQSLARVWQMKHEVESLEREIVTLRAEAGRLTATVNRLRTDPDFIEQVAREDLGLVKPGERVLKLAPSAGQRGR
jgi:cell division protein FtsB